ncbi:MAG TPA: hypothetical protein VKA60_05585 [Blastocatellia bacterium]|nr:hypothetical protein [Blastocatellia bacterium]
MNGNSEEQKIRQWFHEARQADAAHAPAFADVFAAAQSKPRRDVRRLAWRIAFASVALVAIGIAAFVFFEQSKSQPAIRANLQPLPYYPDSPRTPIAPPVPAVMPAMPAKIRLAARSRRVAQPRLTVEPSALLSFKWQSPTDFLLRTPGADLLKNVPRVTDSVIRFDN